MFKNTQGKGEGEEEEGGGGGSGRGRRGRRGAQEKETTNIIRANII